jgi:prepilin-type N-terminal cleavage/methylation domain-containing protein
MANELKERGFTLIELVVVTAVFLFVVGAAIGVLISIVQSQRIVLSEQQLSNQISYVKEYMSKAIRMAKTETNENCLRDQTGADTDYPGYIYLLTRYSTNLARFKGIKFINQSDGNACQEFFLDDTDPANPVLKELKNSVNDSDAVAITSADLKINSVKFSINGSDGSASIPNSNSCTISSQCGASDQDTVQPRVTILLDVKTAINNQMSNLMNWFNVITTGGMQPSDRTIQTTDSRRNLNVNNGQR